MKNIGIMSLVTYDKTQKYEFYLPTISHINTYLKINLKRIIKILYLIFQNIYIKKNINLLIQYLKN